MGLDLIPLNLPLGCGPGPDLPQFPPPLGVGLEGGLPVGGVSLAGGSPSLWQRGGLPGRGVSLAGGSDWQGSPGGGVSQHALRQTPPPPPWTDRHTTFAGGKNVFLNSTS